MISRENRLKRVKGILIILFLLSIIGDFYKVFNSVDGMILKEVMNASTKNTLIIILIVSAAIFLVNLLKFLFFLGFYFCVKAADKKFYKEKLTEIDLKKYKGYFRDVLKNYTPAELSYIDDFKVDAPKDYVCQLLYLKNNSIIDFDDISNKIIIKKNNNLSNLESFIIGHIKNGKFIVPNDDRFLNEVQNESLKKELLKTSLKKINWKKILIFFVVYIVLYIFSFTLSFHLKFENPYLLVISAILLIISFFLTFFFFFFIPIYWGVYLFKINKNPYIRSAKGEEVNKRLEGLKNYLKDFSYMDKRNVNEIIIWEDYLIYSVLFNQNTKVINEIQEKYFANKKFILY